jgi:hypothetical protein
MMLVASGDECGNLLGQEYNRSARGRSVEKAPGSDFNLTLISNILFLLQIFFSQKVLVSKSSP